MNAVLTSRISLTHLCLPCFVKVSKTRIRGIDSFPFSFLYLYNITSFFSILDVYFTVYFGWNQVIQLKSK